MWKVILEWFRNGLNAAATVDTLRREMQQIRMEWSDVLDKLAAREDRERKRSKKSLGAALEPEQLPFEALTREEQKNALRRSL